MDLKRLFVRDETARIAYDRERLTRDIRGATTCVQFMRETDVTGVSEPLGILIRHDEWKARTDPLQQQLKRFFVRYPLDRYPLDRYPENGVIAFLGAFFELYEFKLLNPVKACERDHEILGLVIAFLHTDPSCLKTSFSLLAQVPVPSPLDVPADLRGLAVAGQVLVGKSVFEAFWKYFIHPSLQWRVPLWAVNPTPRSRNPSFTQRYNGPLASSRRVQTGCLSWTRASSSHGSLSK